MIFLKKSLVFILVGGILIRLILSAVTFHADIVHFDLAGYVLGKGNILNFYDYTFNVDKSDQLLKTYQKELFNYPPAVYLFLGSVNRFLTGFEDKTFHNSFLFNVKDTLGSPNLFLHLFILKLPYLIFDLAIAFLLYAFFNTQREKNLAFTLWMFNPWAIYSTFLMGQFDVIPTFFVLLSLYFVLKSKRDLFKKSIISAVILGVGASFKIYPLLLLIPLVATLTIWRQRLVAVLIGVLTYVVTILPFIASAGFRSTALVANQTLKSFYSQIPVSGGESIILFLLGIIFFYLIFLSRNSKIENLWQRFFIILLLFFIFTHYHLQWFLWLTPFLIIELVKTNSKHLFVVILMFVAFLGNLSLFESSLSIGLFSPLNPSLSQIPDIWKMLGKNFDLNFLRSLFQTVFVGCAFFFIYTYFPIKEE